MHTATEPKLVRGRLRLWHQMWLLSLSGTRTPVRFCASGSFHLIAHGLSGRILWACQHFTRQLHSIQRMLLSHQQLSQHFAQPDLYQLSCRWCWNRSLTASWQLLTSFLWQSMPLWSCWTAKWTSWRASCYRSSLSAHLRAAYFAVKWQRPAAETQASRPQSKDLLVLATRSNSPQCCMLASASQAPDQ